VAILSFVNVAAGIDGNRIADIKLVEEPSSNFVTLVRNGRLSKVPLGPIQTARSAAPAAKRRERTIASNSWIPSHINPLRRNSARRSYAR